MHCDHQHPIDPRHGDLGNRRCHAEDPDCPHPDKRPFKPQKMVDWLEPHQLAATALKKTKADMFGAYADKREMQAALRVPGAGPFDVDFDYAGKDRKDLWFDYIADLGDGFAPTYTMARLVAGDVSWNERVLPRGRFVVLGGDQVYPTASREEYENRFLGPFRAANPWSPDDREIYALPGNHDWYDGLTSFIRIFCQTSRAGEGGRWIGAWRTRQRRSYFALRLPHDWWIWAIDSQLESDLDRPQIEYFTGLAAAMKKEAKADPARQKIILMTAEPNWVYSGDEEAKKACCPVKPDDFNTLMWFENRLIRSNGFSLPIVIAGDLHHYVRYTSDDGKTHRITSGGGGAYLMGTHLMPGNIALPEGTTETSIEQMDVRAYRRAECYPTTEKSKQLAEEARNLPLRNKAFGRLLGCIYAAFALLLTSSSFALAIGLALLVIAALHGYTRLGAAGRQPLLTGFEGFAHAFVHIVLAVLTSGLTLFLLLSGDATPNALIVYPLMTLVAFLAGRYLGASLFASYLLWSSERNGTHTEEVFSSMAIEDYKNFLRMHIDEGGRLHVYAIGVDTVPKDYEFPKEGIGPTECGQPWFVSKTPVAPRVVDHIICP